LTYVDPDAEVALNVFGSFHLHKRLDKLLIHYNQSLSGAQWYSIANPSLLNGGTVK
jgi:hypothetical protein